MTSIDYLQFGILSSQDILDMSVVEITTTKLSDSGSIYDHRMGTIDNKILCSTCNKNNMDCPGHFGHISLKIPIIHPLFYKFVIYILKCICKKCSHCLILKDIFELTNKNVSRTTDQYLIYLSEVCQKITHCPHCNTIQPKIIYSPTDNIIYTLYESSNTDSVKTILYENEIYHLFENIPYSDITFMKLDPMHSHPKNMILYYIPVIPPVSRPYIKCDNLTCDDDLTIQYIEILKLNRHLSNTSISDTKKTKYTQSLRFRIKSLYDNSNEKAKHTNGRPMKGFKRRIAGKEGQIRNNIMGKRVNKSARTVIGPDPTLCMDELALPSKIADSLTYPVRVNQLNKEELTYLVNNEKANFIIKNGGESRINLKYATFIKGTQLRINDIIIRHKQKIKVVNCKDQTLQPGDVLIRDNKQVENIVFPHKKHVTLEIGDIVERKLRNGDIVLLNRQPTLHKGSMLAHKIIIRPGKTIRMNLANTKTFNADFDGDEMNIHAPSNPETECELRLLLSTRKNLISSQSSKPNIVIVQDALLGIYLMTQSQQIVPKHVFFNICCKAKNWTTDFILKRSQYIETYYKKNKIKECIYSGNTLFSMLLPYDFIYNSKNINVQQGILCKGPVTKSSLNGQNGIIHTLYSDYGENICVDFIDNVQFIANEFLLYNGFSIGISDCIATKTTEIQNVIDKCFIEAKTIEENTEDKRIQEIRVNASLSKARDHGMRIAKEALPSDNNFISTVTSGSKGDYFNIAQITGLLGQQNFSGQRIHYSLNNNKRALPHYSMGKLSKDDEYESKGFIKNSFIHGLNPKEFWFHAITGREGVTDTAMKTAQSGYVQRRMVKVGEDVTIANDGTVRGANQQIIQFQYGGDGLDPVHTIIRNEKAHICDINRMVDKLNLQYELKNNKYNK